MGLVIGTAGNCGRRWDCEGQRLIPSHWDIIGEQCGFVLWDLCNSLFVHQNGPVSFIGTD